MWISVVIPLYNKGSYIEATIKSVLKQSYHKFEIVIIDDGSTDNSISVVKSFEDERIKLVCQANQGVSKARNNGVDHSEFGIIAFLDADDEWHENYLENIIYLIEQYPQASVFGVACEVKEKNEVKHRLSDIKYGWEGIINDYSEFFNKSIRINSSSFAIKKESFYDVGGYNVGEVLAEDLYFYVKVLRKYKLGYKNTPLVTINKGVEGQTTSKLFDISKDCFLREVSKTLTYKESVDKREILTLKKAHDKRLLGIIITNVKNLNGIDRRYVVDFKTMKGSIIGIGLIIISFLPNKAVNKFFVFCRTLYRSIIKIRKFKVS